MKPLSLLSCLVLCCLAACTRQLTVHDGNDENGGGAVPGDVPFVPTVPGSQPMTQPAPASEDTPASVPNTPNAGQNATAGSDGPTPTAGSDASTAGSGGAPASTPEVTDANPPPPGGVLAGIDQAQPGATSTLVGFEVMAEDLNATEPPAVDASGSTSIMYYAGTNSAAVLHVPSDANGAPEIWHGDAGAFRIFTAAAGQRHATLLYGASYGVYLDGAAPELSGDPASYKEFLAANETGCAWVQYGRGARLGHIVYRPHDRPQTKLTDARRYRASLALSATHLAYVEYTSTDPDSVGQVVVQALPDGEPHLAAASTHHQDHPRLHGNWLVFEEYKSDSEARIVAHPLDTADTRELATGPGYRAHPDVRDGRVVFEDYATGNGDLYVADLRTGDLQPLVTGLGRSTFPRLTVDGLVWLEQNTGNIALVRARWSSSEP